VKEEAEINRIKFWLNVILFYILALIWLIGTVIIGTIFPLWLIGIVVCWSISFYISKSTKVSSNPMEAPFAPKVKLSYKEYDRWANNILHMVTSGRFINSEYGSPLQKMPVLMESMGAALHVWAPIISQISLGCVDVLLFLILISSDSAQALSQSSETQLFGFGLISAILVGSLAGWAYGLFYRWMRAKW
jgi:hypothetical protein